MRKNPQITTNLEQKSTDIVLSIKSVSKKFKLYENIVTGPIKEFLFFWKKSSFYRDVQAVHDINFSVERGEIVGIVGHNGAGKTTLLKMIAGLLSVDEGEILVNGTITAQLALGVGVHPEFTGRENILFGGLLLGLSKNEVLKKIGGIIEFAELGEYIDHPLRTYSSGMKARLLFSISMSVRPDLLIVDEALTTGDEYFVQKCQRRIQEYCAAGTTVLFVSHNLHQVQAICNRCLVMEAGALVFDGPVREGLDIYIKKIHKKTAEILGLKSLQDAQNRRFRGTGEITLHDAYFVVDGERTLTVKVAHECQLAIEFEASEPLSGVTITLDFNSEKSTTTYSFIQLMDLSIAAPEVETFSVTPGKWTALFKFDNFLIGDGIYECGIQFYPYSQNSKFSHDASYCSYERFLTFHAVYENPEVFGRGTLCEVPPNSFEVSPDWRSKN